MNLVPVILGLVLVIVGMIWVSFIFDETEKAYDFVSLKQSEFVELKSEFSGIDIGYYKIYMPEFSGEEIFVQISDYKVNIIQEQRIQTKMSVGYFDFSEAGSYTIKIRNISENSVDLEIEFGNTNSQKMYLPGIMILGGAILLMTLSYFKIKNYIIEQPEENIS